MNVVNTQIAYLLHKRAFRESSSIIDILTKDHGRLSLMVRGARGARSKIAGNLMLFTPLVISWQGKGDLPYLKSVERADLKAPTLKSKALLSAMYMNELLMYMLHKNDVHEDVFEHYHHCLYLLERVGSIEISLREFETKLLQILGFGLNLQNEADTGEKIQLGETYGYFVEHGAVKSGDCVGTNVPQISGACLQALEKHNYQEISDNPAHLAELKQLMRFVINHHLGNKKLKSREMFKPVVNESLLRNS